MLELCTAVDSGIEVLPVTVEGTTWGGGARVFPDVQLDVPEKVGELRWDSEDAIAAWNAAQAQMAAKLEVPDGISPKGRPNVTTPQTGNVSSRVGR